ncbi:uncharacterized protein [Coffea arabica]|uniref:Uncharacterized protein n=1 Tax=Coffea arabica TaxID=13443 RepID=A0A6P6X265_COFAR|nr:heat shock 70 kDa protein-like [Coffea arabica]
MDLSKKNVIKPLKQAVKIKGSEETNSHEIVLFGGTNSNIPKVRDQNGRRMGEKKEAKRQFNILGPELMPYSLGIETEGGVTEPVISSGSDFSTKILKFQFKDEGRLTKDGQESGRFELSDIPPAPRGVPQIGVTFKVDTNGLLHVIAEDKATKVAIHYL